MKSEKKKKRHTGRMTRRYVSEVTYVARYDVCMDQPYCLRPTAYCTYDEHMVDGVRVVVPPARASLLSWPSGRVAEWPSGKQIVDVNMRVADPGASSSMLSLTKSRPFKECNTDTAKLLRMYKTKNRLERTYKCVLLAACVHRRERLSPKQSTSLYACERLSFVLKYIDLHMIHNLFADL